MPAPLVVGYDGSDHGDDALALARLLAGAGADRAELIVACAYPEDPLGASATAHELARELHEDAQRHLAQARERLDGGEGASFRAIAGPAPARILHELAEDVGAQAIVIGATHHGSAIRLLTGSTPERVLDHAPCPVAVAPEGFARQRAGAPRQVAVAYDGSQEAERALAEAAALARRTGARLRLVTVVNRTAGAYPPLDPGAYAEISDIAREEARARLDAALARLGGEELGGAEVEGAVLDGDPARALVAESAADDLLFAGSRGHGPFRRVLLGSLTGRLLREAACPVVIVPRGGGHPR